MGSPHPACSCDRWGGPCALWLVTCHEASTGGRGSMLPVASSFMPSPLGVRYSRGGHGGRHLLEFPVLQRSQWRRSCQVVDSPCLLLIRAWESTHQVVVVDQEAPGRCLSYLAQILLSRMGIFCSTRINPILLFSYILTIGLWVPKNGTFSEDSQATLCRGNSTLLSLNVALRNS